MTMRIVLSATLLAAAWCAQSSAQASVRHRIDIAPQELGLALKALAQQTNIQLVYPADLVKGQLARAVSGSMTPEQALDRLLATTRLKYEFVDARTVTLTSGTDHAGKAPATDETANVASHNRMLLALAEVPAPASVATRYAYNTGARDGAADAKPEQSSSKKTASGESGEVIVTGSRIKRPASQVAANLLVVDAEALRATGESSLEKALRQLPQNILGTTEIGASVILSGMSFNGAINITGASNINLRGLGSESTLVLVDGRRIGKSGVYGGATDISGIPLSTVERVEIMLDGASSVYGSDAVGGVVNIILKKAYRGAEVFYEMGIPDAGGFEEHTATMSGGTAWGSGQVRGTLQFFKSTNLDGTERPERIYSNRWDAPGGIAGTNLFFTYNGQNYTTAQLAGLGLTPTSPGVKGINFTQIPVGYSGAGPLPLQSLPPLINNSDLKQGMSLLPAREDHTLQLGFDQAFDVGGRALTLSGSFFLSSREVYAGRGSFYSSFSLPASNPQNPFGKSATIYWEIPELGVMHWQTDETIARGTLVAEMPIGRNWQASLGVSKSRDDIDSMFYNEPSFTNPPGINFVVGDIVAANSAAALAPLVAAPYATKGLNSNEDADFGINGPLFSLPGGQVHFAAGLEWRKESLHSLSEGGAPTQIAGGFNGSIPQTQYNGTVSRIQRSGYAELLIPFVAEKNAMKGVRNLSLSGGARLDDYSIYGSDVTWSAGVVWNPIDSLRFKVNRSTSFVAPTPREGLAEAWYRDMRVFANPGDPGLPLDIVTPAGVPTGQVDWLGTYVYYGNPDLGPENASSWSTGLEYKPSIVPGLTLSATWHKTDYRNRIVSAPDPLLVQGTDYIGIYPNLSRNPDGTIIWDLRAINAAYMKNSGIDYQARYDLETSVGDFLWTANIYYTDEFIQQDFAGAKPATRVGNLTTIAYGVTPRTRYATNLGWYRGGMAVNMDVSATSAVRAYVTATQLRTNKAAVLTNLVFSYDLDESPLKTSVPGWLQGGAVTLKVLNVLNDQPYISILNLASGKVESYYYNSHYANPRGRMFHFNLTKRF